MWEDDIQMKQIPFVRGTKTDAFGNTGMLAVKTEWRMVKFVEPESDILNQSLYAVRDMHSALRTDGW